MIQDLLRKVLTVREIFESINLVRSALVKQTPHKASLRVWLSGRASPCQGECRAFESRHPLNR